MPRWYRHDLSCFQYTALCGLIILARLRTYRKPQICWLASSQSIDTQHHISGYILADSILISGSFDTPSLFAQPKNLQFLGTSSHRHRQVEEAEPTLESAKKVLQEASLELETLERHRLGFDPNQFDKGRMGVENNPRESCTSVLPMHLFGSFFGQELTREFKESGEINSNSDPDRRTEPK